MFIDITFGADDLHSWKIDRSMLSLSLIREPGRSNSYQSSPHSSGKTSTDAEDLELGEDEEEAGNGQMQFFVIKHNLRWTVRLNCAGRKVWRCMYVRPLALLVRADVEHLLPHICCPCSTSVVLMLSYKLFPFHNPVRASSLLRAATCGSGRGSVKV